MISAKEARELSNVGADEILKKIEDKIKYSCESKETQITLRSEPFGYWGYHLDTNDIDPLGKKVVQELRELGYKVSSYYEAKQFVDVALVISWEE